MTDSGSAARGSWVGVADQNVARRAQKVAVAVSEPFRDPHGLWAECSADPADPGDAPWYDPGLASGYSGVALLAAQLDLCCPGEGWDRIGHRYLAAATADPQAVARLGPSLHSGWAGLAFTAQALARGRPRYRRLLAQADLALAAGARRLTLEATGSAQQPPPVIDLISGLAGVTGVLLIRRGNPEVNEALKPALGALASLAATANGLPRITSPGSWGVFPPHEGTDPVLNLGLAHGLPGVVAAMALAALDGVVVPGQHEAIEKLVDLLVRYRIEDEWGPAWPTAVTLADGAPQTRPVRMGWCYGAGGCARALWLAGRALARPDWTELGLRTIKTALRRPTDRRGLGSTTFCHGTAGFIHICLRFAADAGDTDIIASVAREVATLVAAFDPATRFGYQRINAAGCRCDSPALLDGAAGVALVLLAAGYGVQPSWDRAFLLA